VRSAKPSSTTCSPSSTTSSPADSAAWRPSARTAPHTSSRSAGATTPSTDAIDIRGFDFEQTRKFRDVKRSGRAAIVVDDLASASPWRPRGVEVRGRAEAIDGPGPLIRLHPERVVSWGIDGEELSSRAVGEARRPSV
jgi:PPOX class F420-dependent enzyme/OxyR family protein